MAAVMADHNIEGHFRALILMLGPEPWKGIWEELDIPVKSFESLGISPDIGDAELWHTCSINHIGPRFRSPFEVDAAVAAAPNERVAVWRECHVADPCRHG